MRPLNAMILPSVGSALVVLSEPTSLLFQFFGAPSFDDIHAGVPSKSSCTAAAAINSADVCDTGRFAVPMFHPTVPRLIFASPCPS